MSSITRATSLFVSSFFLTNMHLADEGRDDGAAVRTVEILASRTLP